MSVSEKAQADTVEVKPKRTRRKTFPSRSVDESVQLPRRTSKSCETSPSGQKYLEILRKLKWIKSTTRPVLSSQCTSKLFDSSISPIRALAPPYRRCTPDDSPLSSPSSLVCYLSLCTWHSVRSNLVNHIYFSNSIVTDVVYH